MAPVFYNETSIIGSAIDSFTANISGSQFLTLFVILLVVLLLLAVLRIPLEYGILLMMPLLIIMAAFQGAFLAVFGIILIYMAILFAKYYFTSR